MLAPITAADGVLLKLQYATPDNLTGRPIYRRPVALLHPVARAALLAARDLAAPLGLRLLVYDAFRPIEAQWALWQAVTDKRFVADPSQGGVHPRGVAVDLTLADGAGTALDMGTGFDAVTDDSAHGCTRVSPMAQRNRTLLLGLMTAAGWDHYRLEWWHYHLPNARSYPALSASAVPGGPM